MVFSALPLGNRYMVVSINGGTPSFGWLTMESPIEKGWFGGTPISGNLYLYIYIYIYIYTYIYIYHSYPGPISQLLGVTCSPMFFCHRYFQPHRNSRRTGMAVSKEQNAVEWLLKNGWRIFATSHKMSQVPISMKLHETQGMFESKTSKCASS